MSSAPNPSTAFLDAGVGHGSLEAAEAIRLACPELATRSIHAAAVLGDEIALRRHLELDPSQAKAKGGPRGWDPLTYLCFSRYLRLDPSRSDGFVRAATALLDAGASAKTGFYDPTHQPSPALQSVLYGASGVAHHAGLTRLLLEHGADPNDGEVAYHSPEGWDNGAMQAVVETGQVNTDNLATMLLRKCDWHDLEGVRWLLAHGAEPNRVTRWGKTALQQAVLRDNAPTMVELLLDHGADPTVQIGTPSGDKPIEGSTAISLAARRGRADILDLLERRSIPPGLAGVESLIAACARNDSEGIRSLTERHPEWVGALLAGQGTLLAEFAGNGNTDGVRNLLELGASVRAVYHHGDGYFGIARNSTTLHVAAWRARHATVRLLIERGAEIDARDWNGQTPLALAVRACVNSHWTNRRSPESVAALLQAGASPSGIPVPCGYAEVDDLLRQHE